MPSTPPEAAASSRDVTVASGECRQNAIKSRRENDWFGHDATVASASAGSRSTASGLSAGGNDSRARSAAAAPRTPNKTAKESEEWFRYDVSTSTSSNGTGTPTSGSGPEVTSTKVRVQHGTQQDWYKHGVDVPDPPSLDQQRSKARSRRSACAEVRHKTTDPNEWFRHDHARGGSRGRIPEGATRPAKKPAKVASPTSLWVVYPEDGSSPAELASTPRTRSHEADDYYRRDKVGSSADWFSHEHAHDETSGSGGQPPRMRGTPEGGEIASRLKGESEDWFSHDGNQNYVSPLPVGKGHSPLSKELMDRAQGSEIRQIFQMEEKLRATWNAPPPLLGPEVSVVQQSPAASSSSDVVESVRATIDNVLLSNGQKNNNNNNNDATTTATTTPH